MENGSKYIQEDEGEVVRRVTVTDFDSAKDLIRWLHL